MWGSSCILRKFRMKHLLNKHAQTIPSTLLKTACRAAALRLHTVVNLQLQWHLMTYGSSLYCCEGSHTYLRARKWISTACVESQDFCPVGISLCFYHSWKPHFNRGFCQTPKLQKAFPFANEQRVHVCIFFFPPLRHFLWNGFHTNSNTPPQPFAIELWSAGTQINC